jgi:sigma-E factor negative regulatory protein RseC
MNASVCIEQKGMIESISNHQIRIRIDRESACGHCNVRGICNLSESSERVIEVNDSSHTFSVGEMVQVNISRNMGNKAVMLGYLFPFIVLVSSLVILTAYSLPEWLAGLLSLLLLVPYFVILYLFRDKLRRTFTFSIHKSV